jgi:iron complex transport system permease protein
MKPPIPYPLLIAGLALLSLALAALSMLIGASGGLSELLAMIASGNADTATMIMMEVRLPRTLLALMIGATLGLAGASLQGYLRNHICDLTTELYRNKIC